MKENEFINKTQIYGINDLIADYKRKTKGHFFDLDTLKGFNSRISANLYYKPERNSIVFITSERKDDSWKRLYTLRTYDVLNGEIDKIGESQQYTHLVKAKTVARRV